MNKYIGEKFLCTLYRGLHEEEQVKNSSLKSDSKYERIRKYLDRLEKIHKKLLNRDRISLLKRFYYDKYVIKKENIPDDYFLHLEENALNRGFGHIKYSKYIKDYEKDNIINDQKKSLDIWIDYFCSEEITYPVWFKYYVFQSVVKLGKYNKSKNTFNQRTKETVTVFPELNREAIALLYDYLLLNLNGKAIDDYSINKLIESGCFKKIYAYLLKKVTSNSFNGLDCNDGVWVKYEQGSDHMLLVNSILGKGTGWCTAGVETAKSQLAGGDFFVYYSYDMEGNATIPRLAIRMSDEKIAEIRGIEEGQHIESEMEKIIYEKIQEFPDKDEYLKKVKDMEFLTKIYKKYKSNETLLKEELRFLYEIDDKIKGFGYEHDPRIDEVLSSRNKKVDLCCIFDCEESQIVLRNDVYNHSDLFNGKIVYFEQDLDLDFLVDAFNLILPKYVKGYLNLRNVKTVERLILPEFVGEYLDLSDVEYIDNLVLPKFVGGAIYLDNLKIAKYLKLPYTSLAIYLKKMLTFNSLEIPNSFDTKKLFINNNVKEAFKNKVKKKTVC